ncbi:MAG TPA: FmdB family zinc ribbon protein [Phycisphaerae bacterium]|nr:FmdB family zinc ribbon protein [Phycisphaerae bacterium]
MAQEKGAGEKPSMPTYEYECKDCGNVLEIFQSITAAPLRKAHCDKCGSRRPVKRLISTGGAVLFKGSGFYQTDYRSDNYKKAAESESKPADDSKKDSGEKKDTTAKKESSVEKSSPVKKPGKKKKD